MSETKHRTWPCLLKSQSQPVAVETFMYRLTDRKIPLNGHTVCIKALSGPSCFMYSCMKSVSFFSVG